MTANRAIFAAVIVLLIPALAVAASGNVGIVGDESTPAAGTELTAGEQYDFHMKVYHELSGASTGVIKLYFEGISSSAEDTAEVSEGSGYSWVNDTLQIPSDWSGDLEVSVIFETSGGDYIDADTVTYTVNPPDNNSEPEITDFSPSDTAFEISKGTSQSFSVTASDPDGDTLSYDWYLTDRDADTTTHVGSGTSYSHTFDQTGNYSLTVEVSDGTTTVDQTWIVYVTDSDSVPPTVSTEGTVDITQTSATIEGTLDNLGTGSSADVWLEYREKGTQSWTETTVQTLSSAGGFSATLDSLSAGTTYEYRAVAESADGRDEGDIREFTTAADGDIYINESATTPTPTKNLTAGDDYDLTMAVGYTLESESSGTIRLYYEGISSASEENRSVSPGQHTVTLSEVLSIPSDWSGELQVTVVLESGSGDLLDADTVTYQVEPAGTNSAPTIDSFTPEDTAFSVQNDSTLDFSVTASDGDNDDLQYTWSVNNLSDDADPRDVGTGDEYTHHFDEPGEFTIRVEVSDGNTTVEQVWTVEVTIPTQNRTPTITRVNPASSSVSLLDGERLVFEVEASDADLDMENITWYIDGSVEHRVFLGTSETVTETFEYRFETNGTYEVVALVMDATGNLDRVSWTVTVGSGAGSSLPSVYKDSPPRDVDNDGSFEDLNGNGRLDFHDVVLFLNHLNDPVITDHPKAYDFNNNDRIGVGDLIALFNEI